MFKSIDEIPVKLLGQAIVNYGGVASVKPGKKAVINIKLSKLYDLVDDYCKLSSK